MITSDILSQCLPEATADNVEKYAVALDMACHEFDINTPERIAAFIAQVGHESGNLRYAKENLNYSAEGLVKTFPKYFKDIDTTQYARNPEAIASRVYANRMGNGDEESGDGWKYRGRGLIQLTGHDNYLNCGKGLDVDLINEPEYLETPDGAARSAGWFWNSHNLNALADAGDIKTMTKKINGGFIGLEDRIKHYNHALEVLNG
jgi:putative chitinase